MAALNTLVHLLVPKCKGFPGHLPKVRIVESLGMRLFNFIYWMVMPACFRKCSFTFVPSGYECRVSPTLGISQLLNYCQCDRYKAIFCVVLTCIFHVIIIHPVDFLKMPIFCTLPFLFFYWVVCLFLHDFEFFLIEVPCILETNPLLFICITCYFLPVYGFMGFINE